jgi:hypothetical protein
VTEPYLRVAASGDGGSGYAIPFWPDEGGKPTKVPGVTTVLNAINKPALLQWTADQVAGYAVTHIDELLNRDESAGFHFLRYLHTQPKSWEPLDDDNLRFAHRKVLHDAGNLGTRIHEYTEADLLGQELPPILSFEMQEMVTEWEKFKSDHWIEPVLVEATFINRSAGYAGTADGLWIIDGVPTLVDVKTSRNTWDEHWAQIAALGACDEMAELVDKDAEGAFEYKRKDEVTYWRSAPVPPFSQYRILHIRPSDTDNKGNYMAPFCRLLEPPSLDMDPFYDLFLGALDIKKSQRAIKALKKTNETEED